MMVPAPIISQLFGLNNKLDPVANTISFSKMEEVPSFFTANEGGSISKVDAVTNKVIDTIKEDGVIHNVQVSPDGKVLGATFMPNTVSVIDNETNKVVSTVPVGVTPNGISFKQ